MSSNPWVNWPTYSTTSSATTWYTAPSYYTTAGTYASGDLSPSQVRPEILVALLEDKGYKVLKKQRIAKAQGYLDYTKYAPTPLDPNPLEFNLLVFEGYVLPEAAGLYVMPDGSELHVDQYGNYKVLDQDAKVTYKANRIREFSRYINASELLEEFVR